MELSQALDILDRYDLDERDTTEGPIKLIKDRLHDMLDSGVEKNHTLNPLMSKTIENYVKKVEV